MVEERAHVVSLVTEGAADEIIYFSLEYDYISTSVVTCICLWNRSEFFKNLTKILTFFLVKTRES